MARLFLLTQLCEAQHATVLQLPASPRAAIANETERRDLNRQDAKPQA